jgi:hypothetical protein
MSRFDLSEPDYICERYRCRIVRPRGRRKWTVSHRRVGSLQSSGDGLKGGLACLIPSYSRLGGSRVAPLCSSLELSFSSFQGSLRSRRACYSGVSFLLDWMLRGNTSKLT